MEEVNQKKYFLMAGSYDSTISFWEFDIEKLPTKKSICSEVSYNLNVKNENSNDKFYFIHEV